MATGLAQIPGVEVLNAVEFTQVLTAFGDDERTIEAGRRLLADGTVFTPATWRGGRQRCSVSSWATTPHDVDLTLEAVRRVAASL